MCGIFEFQIEINYIEFDYNMKHTKAQYCLINKFRCGCIAQINSVDI
jgi:hypothetical protein